MINDKYLTPHWSDACLVTVDMQVDFADGGVAEIPGTSAVAEKVRRVAEAFRRAGRPVVHLVRLYVPGSSDVDLVRRQHVESGGHVVAPGSPGSSIVAGVARDPSGGPTPLQPEVLLAGRIQQLSDSEVVVYKPRWGGFYRTGLQEWLRERSVDTVVVAGCNLPNCPRATLFEASERDFRTVLVHDAVSQVTAERTADLGRIGVTVLAADDVVSELEGASAEPEGQGRRRSRARVPSAADLRRDFSRRLWPPQG